MASRRRILDALMDWTRYRVDLVRGEVISQKTKSPLFIYAGHANGVYSGVYYLRLVVDGERIALPVSHCIWMYGHRRTLPRGFVVHHINLDSEDNRFENLIAVSKPDHTKLHRDDAEDDLDSPIPF